MRVISGVLKGRKLVDFKASHIRPTTDRVKESIFNVIQFQIDGAMVLDLFAGTGNLGIEALSRGASKILAVEKHKKSWSIISENLSAFDIGPEVYTLNKSDVFKFLKKENLEPYDIIFIDPPFTELFSQSLMEIFSQKTDLKPNCIVMIESSSQEKLNANYGSLENFKTLNFGDKFVSFFKVT